ncbi:hypothetical protein JW960_28995 [candidate division KSB1 bacterium]|nr:hypothetical protein [candidate division KSB1 bacterium]
MAKKHWQIYRRDGDGTVDTGRFETLPVEIAPKHVVRTALKAANLIGDGFYGVDLKEVNGNCYLIEVNDNPSIDAGVEDAILKDELYNRVMQVFLNRIERMKEGLYRS